MNPWNKVKEISIWKQKFREFQKNFSMWRFAVIRKIRVTFKYFYLKVTSPWREKAVAYNQSNFTNKMNFSKLTLTNKITSRSEQINLTLKQEHCPKRNFNEIPLYFLIACQGATLTKSTPIDAKEESVKINHWRAKISHKFGVNLKTKAKHQFNQSLKQFFAIRYCWRNNKKPSRLNFSTIRAEDYEFRWLCERNSTLKHDSSFVPKHSKKQWSFYQPAEYCLKVKHFLNASSKINPYLKHHSHAKAIC